MNATERAAKELDKQTVLAWLDGQIAETERCIEARLQAASTWRGGASEEWRSVGCTLTKAGRIEVAEKELRIAGKYRHDLECLRVLRKHFADPDRAALHQAIMNLPCKPVRRYATVPLNAAYDAGHRDARHAAAELVQAAEPAELVDQPVTEEWLRSRGFRDDIHTGWYSWGHVLLLHTGDGRFETAWIQPCAVYGLDSQEKVGALCATLGVPLPPQEEQARG